MAIVHRGFLTSTALAALFALVACSSGMSGGALPPDQVAAPDTSAGGVEEAPGGLPDPSTAASPGSTESDVESLPSPPAAAPGAQGATGAAASPKAGAPAAAAGGAAKTAPAGQTALAAQPQTASNLRSVCGQPLGSDRRSCDSVIRTDAGGAAFNGYHGDDLLRAFAASKPCRHVAPYCASDLQAAYGVVAAAKNRGAGTTLAIVDAYGYAQAAQDLAKYRKTMGLPPCTLANGCLKIVNQQGLTHPLPPPNTDASDDWRPEQALDLDMASAICPRCKILLVQAKSDFNTDLDAGVNTAVNLGAVAVSNSYGGRESNDHDTAYDHFGRAIVASSGDAGTGAQQPCSYAHVVCVGGTHLEDASNARGWRETAWAGAGSGCSRYVAKPHWQHDKGCTMRTEADVAAVADPNTGVAVYDSTGGGWIEMGGTSVSSPIVAAIFALAGNTGSMNGPEWIARHGSGSGYHDVTRGRNGQCAASMLYVCVAGPGYDGPTGWGTPNGLSGF